MTFTYYAPSKSSRPGTLAALVSLTCCVLALAGCNDKPGEKIDNRPPANMPTPTIAGAKPVEQKPAAPIVPPPTEAEIGVPIYPGAKTYVDAGGVAVSSQKDPTMSTALLETPDPVDKVVDYYRQRIQQTDANGAMQPVEPREDTQNGRRKVVMTGNDAQGNVVLAQVREDAGKTVIELMRTQVKLPPGLSGDAPTTAAPTTSGSPR